jgi:molybdate transport system substrate-binding protein
MPSDSRQATVSWRPLLFRLVSEYVECRAAKFIEMTAPSGVPSMKTMPTAFKAITIAVTSLLLFAGAALAAEIHVMNSGGFSAAYRALAPEFEAATKNLLVTAWGPSMGTTPEAIPNRLARGEPADVLIMVGDALDELIKRGKAVAGSRVDLGAPR